MAHFDLPLRTRKDLARAAQLRNLTLSRPTRSALPVMNFDETYLPSPRRRPARPLVETCTPLLHYSDSNPRSRPAPKFETCPPLLHYPDSDPRSRNGPIDLSTLPDYTPTPRSASYSYPRREEHPSSSSSVSRMSFSTAARSLYWALQYAITNAERLERDFQLETQYLSYADERTRAHLWTLKLSYRGWQDGDADVPPPDDKGDYFAMRAGRLLDAIDDMRNAEYPSSREWAGSGRYGGGVSMEDVRLATKKLGVSFGAIRELLEGVRVERGRCGVLVRELKSAWEVLNEIKEVWDRGLRRDGNVGGRRVFERAEKIPVAAFEEEWPEYRGE